MVEESRVAHWLDLLAVGMPADYRNAKEGCLPNGSNVLDPDLAYAVTLPALPAKVANADRTFEDNPSVGNSALSLRRLPVRLPVALRSNPPRRSVSSADPLVRLLP